MEEKVYCEKCKRLFYDKILNTPRCKIMIDDYFSKEHEVEFIPEIRNFKNDCPSFIPIESKKEE